MWEGFLLLAITGLVLSGYNLIRIYFADQFCKKIIAMGYHWDMAFYKSHPEAEYDRNRNPFYKFLYGESKSLLDDIMHRWWKSIDFWQDKLDIIVKDNLKFEETPFKSDQTTSNKNDLPVK